MITTKDRIDAKRAKEVDVPELFNQIKIEYEMKGKESFYLAENFLIVWRKMKNGCWEFFDNGKRKHSDIIDFIRARYSLGFQDAVKFINEKMVKVVACVNAENKEFPMLKYDSDAYGYLVKERGISAKKVDTLIKNELILQSQSGKDLIFPCFNKEMEMVNMEMFDVQDKDDEGVLYSEILEKAKYAFAIVVGNPETLYFFQGAVELLSFWTLMPNLKDVVLISLAGLREEVIAKYTELFPGAPMCLCVSTGEAGQSFFSEVKAKYELADCWTIDGGYATWNECLLGSKAKDENEQMREVS